MKRTALHSTRTACLLALAAACLLAVGDAAAQRGSRGSQRGGFGGGFGGGGRQLYDRGDFPTWENNPAFSKDVFTFARVQWSSGYGGGGSDFGGGFGRGSRGYGGRWSTDYPDSDNNFSYRLQQLTSLKVNPEPVVVQLTDDELFDYPFIYIIEPGDLVFSEREVENLRKYLLSGGFLMVDDFWGDYQWENFERQMKRVFPDRPMKELDVSHEVFNCIYKLKEKPQVCSYDNAQRGRGPNGELPVGATPITWEDSHGGDCRTVHYKGIFDDAGRMMAIICHNTDLGDGWEREGMAQWYFSEFAENKSYPMGINIVFYAMTH